MIRLSSALFICLSLFSQEFDSIFVKLSSGRITQGETLSNYWNSSTPISVECHLLSESFQLGLGLTFWNEESKNPLIQPSYSAQLISILFTKRFQLTKSITLSTGIHTGIYRMSFEHILPTQIEGQLTEHEMVLGANLEINYMLFPSIEAGISYNFSKVYTNPSSSLTQFKFQLIYIMETPKWLKNLLK